MYLALYVIIIKCMCIENHREKCKKCNICRYVKYTCHIFICINLQYTNKTVKLLQMETHTMFCNYLITRVFAFRLLSIIVNSKQFL